MQWWAVWQVLEQKDFINKLLLSTFPDRDLKKVNHSLHQGQLLQFFWLLLEDTIKLWR